MPIVKCNFANVIIGKTTIQKLLYTMLDLIETRNRHFREACLRVMARLDAKSNPSLRMVAELAAREPAPFYYCTFEYALRCLRVLRHGRLRMRTERRRAMWAELDSKVRARQERTGESVSEALARVLASSGASQFFISPERAYLLACQLF